MGYVIKHIGSPNYVKLNSNIISLLNADYTLTPFTTQATVFDNRSDAELLAANLPRTPYGFYVEKE